MVGVAQMGQAYRYSGIMPAGAAAAGLGWGMLTALIGGAIYGWVCLYVVAVFDAGWVQVVVKLLCAAILAYRVGVDVAGAVVARKGRSVGKVLALTLACAVAGLYVAWVVYVYLLGRLEHGVESVPLTLRRAALPVVLAGEMAKAAKFGTWELFDEVMPPWVYWASWMVEAVVIVGLAMRVAWGRVVARVFCEACGGWCSQERTLAQLEFGAGDILREDLAAGRMERIEALDRKKKEARAWCDVRVEACDGCEQTRAVTVVTQDWGSRKRGEKRDERRLLLRRVMATEAQCAAIRAAGERNAKG